MQGSKQARIFITSELRTDKVGCAGLCPITHIRVLTFRQNKSGTAEVVYTFVSYRRQRCFLFQTNYHMEVIPMEYKNTIITPKTGFPMKAGLPAREPGMLQAWEEQDLYNALLEKNKD